VIVHKAFMNGANWVKPGQSITVADGRGKELEANKLVRRRGAGGAGTVEASTNGLDSSRGAGTRRANSASRRQANVPTNKQALAPAAPSRDPVTNQQNPRASSGDAPAASDKDEGDGAADA